MSDAHPAPADESLAIVDTPEQAAARQLVDTCGRVTHVSDDGQVVDPGATKAHEDFSIAAPLKGGKPRTMSIREAVMSDTFIQRVDELHAAVHAKGDKK